MQAILLATTRVLAVTVTPTVGLCLISVACVAVTVSLAWVATVCLSPTSVTTSAVTALRSATQSSTRRALIALAGPTAAVSYVMMSVTSVVTYDRLDLR
jgi:hypothetical protein